MPLLLPGARKAPIEKDVQDHPVAREYEPSDSPEGLSYHTPVDSHHDGIGYDDDLDSLFDECSDTCESTHGNYQEMASQGPYYDNAGPVDLNGVDISLDGYDHVADHSSRYPEPFQPGPSPHLHANADLHNLVAAAHSVAEQEQNQHRLQQSAAIKPFGQASKRKLNANARKPRTKRHQQVQVAQDDDAPTAEAAPPLAGHSASIRGTATLFRPVPEKSKKWTRPPMNTLFNSFRISAQQFLHLQEDAKNFMLDKDHPDRVHLVGIRGRGDNKNIKLALVREVEQFLGGGAGDKYFPEQPKQSEPTTAGATAEQKGPEQATTELTDTANVDPSITATESPAPTAKEDPRPFEWPRDRDRLVDLCMPLLRKMVTNEKQRKYAEKTRRENRETGPDSERPTVSLQVFVISTDEQGEATVAAQIQGHMASREDVYDAEGKTQWEGFEATLGSYLQNTTVQVQTAAGLVYVQDAQGLSQAVAQVLKAPWLERTVRVVVESNGPTEAEVAIETAMS